jgi:hypothetical protein
MDFFSELARRKRKEINIEAELSFERSQSYNQSNEEEKNSSNQNNDILNIFSIENSEIINTVNNVNNNQLASIVNLESSLSHEDFSINEVDFELSILSGHVIDVESQLAADIQAALHSDNEVGSIDVLNENGLEVLEKMSIFLSKFPDIDIRVECHTFCAGCGYNDGSDNACGSITLANSRALSVIKYLQSKGCINTFIPKGWGCTHPELKAKKLIRIFS